VSDVDVWVLLPEICLIKKVNFRDMAMILVVRSSGIVQVMNITS